MPDEITPAPGADAPPASPADAGNPGNNPPANPTDTAPKDPKPAEKVSNATHARLRIAERALKQKQAEKQPAPPPDDGIDPSEKEIIEKVTEQKYGHLDKELTELRSESDTKAIREEVDKTISENQYGEFLTADEKDRVHQLSLDDKYVNLSIDELITLSVSGRMAEIGAEIAKKASAKIKDSKIPTSGSSMGTPKKTAMDMTDAEWAQERKKAGFSM